MARAGYCSGSTRRVPSIEHVEVPNVTTNPTPLGDVTGAETRVPRRGAPSDPGLSGLSADHQ